MRRERDPLVAVRLPRAVLDALDEAVRRDLVRFDGRYERSSRSAVIRQALIERLGIDRYGCARPTTPVAPDG